MTAQLLAFLAAGIVFAAGFALVAFTPPGAYDAGIAGVVLMIAAVPTAAWALMPTRPYRDDDEPEDR